ncbi:hypothetical protein [Streptomyces sp. NPDC093094]|uniref:hypothetical protein n=1 Tax=Streptomyces sp. NPDC093094 TaxID=3366026 RepID=UPI0038254695
MYRSETRYRVRSRVATAVLVGLLTATGAACEAKESTRNGSGDDTGAAGAPAAAPGGGSDIRSLAGDHGPDTCRQGHVWREARPTDHVCVEPQVRDQARDDNARADDRRSPGNNGYGPDACATGYVWREAYRGDIVCVEPQVRDQARDDNARADDRRVSTRLWKSRWYPSPKCDGDTCTSTGDQDIPRIRLNGDHYDFGRVRLVVRRDSDNHELWSGTVTATRHTGFAGGSFGRKTTLIDCSAYGGQVNGHAQAYDVTSGRWSARLPLSIGCATL